jgi:hypothetical protein
MMSVRKNLKYNVDSSIYATKVHAYTVDTEESPQGDTIRAQPCYIIDPSKDPISTEAGGFGNSVYVNNTAVNSVPVIVNNNDVNPVIAYVTNDDLNPISVHISNPYVTVREEAINKITTTYVGGAAGTTELWVSNGLDTVILNGLMVEVGGGITPLSATLGCRIRIYVTTPLTELGTFTISSVSNGVSPLAKNPAIIANLTFGGGGISIGAVGNAKFINAQLIGGTSDPNDITVTLWGTVTPN